ncbi:MAG: hypothetical protein LBJ64_11265, partial [Deltaproteobacteria bacterium]|nr:hypothetical protein [Deltaproteobacteria bacterium]
MSASNAKSTKAAKKVSPKDLEKKENFDHDGFWKDLMKRYFYPLLQRAFPNIYESCDASAEPTFLDQELHVVLNDPIMSLRHKPNTADCLVRVPWKNRPPEWLFVHVAAQSDDGDDLPERMLEYVGSFFIHYKLMPELAVIITEKRPESEPSFYHYKN